MDAINAAMREVTEAKEWYKQACRRSDEAASAASKDTEEARAQRDWLIKECGRVGVTVNVCIGAPLTEAYSLVNNASKDTEPR